MTKALGIIGGLGPAATADFFQKLIAATPARKDQDHIRVIIDCNPRIPDRNAAISGAGEDPAPHLIAAAQGLERAGADLLVLICNTAHYWQRQIAAAVSIPFLSIIDTTVNAAALLDAKRIGVLAADGGRAARLYETALEARAMTPVRLDDAAQARFMALVYAIKGGGAGEQVRADMRTLTQTLIDQGAGAIIAGCTEVPLVLAQEDLPVPLLNSTDLLVARVLHAAL